MLKLFAMIGGVCVGLVFVIGGEGEGEGEGEGGFVKEYVAMLQWKGWGSGKIIYLFL